MKMFPYENPSPDMVKRLQEEVGMTPDTLKEDIPALKEWLRKQPHLPNITDDRLLKKFLYLCKNSLEKTKFKLDIYYTSKAANPDYFQNRDPEDTEIKTSVQTAFFTVLPKLTNEYDRVTILKIFDPDVSKFNPSVTFKVSCMIIDSCLVDDECRSHVIIYDLKGGTMGHAAAITHRDMKMLYQSSLKGMPLRYSAFHYINAPTYANPLINLGKSLLNDKLKKRVFVHSDLEGLHKKVPKEILPAEYGGTYSKTMHELRDITYNHLLEHKQWFIEQEKMFADESKRLGKTNSVEHVQGSFRKINID